MSIRNTAAVIVSSLAASLALGDEEGLRAGKLELYGAADYATAGSDGALTVTAGGFSAPVSYGSFIGGGLGFGYNLDNHWNLNSTLTGGTVKARTELLGSTVNSDALAIRLGLNVDYNILRSSLTPFLTAGLAVTDFSDSVETRNGFGSAKLEYFQPLFGFGAGGGVRWDFDEHWFAKALYRAEWRTGVADLSGSQFVHAVSIGIGYKF